MKYKSFTDTECLKYLKAFGLPEDVSKTIVRQVRLWEKNNGVEWTIKRLKAYKVAYIRMLGGLKPLFLDTWTKVDSKGRPRGPWRKIFTMPEAQALGCLMIYTMYASEEVTPSQFQKFSDSVTSKQIDPWSYEQVSAMLTLMPLGELRNVRTKPRFCDLKATYNRKVKTPRFLDDSCEKLGSVEMGLEVLLETATHPIALRYMETLSKARELPDSLYNVYAKSQLDLSLVDYSQRGHIVGKVAWIQEPGFKLRSIANPFAIFQVLLSRLGNQCYTALRSVPEDCTFNQDQGVRDIQEAMKNGIELSALDLSSATDRFPAELTFKVLTSLGYDSNDIQLFRDLARGSWLLPHGEEITWNNGQPLGVYPSFGAFALSHHFVIQSLEPRFYRILGDDLVIDTETVQRARELYSLLGVPISEDKSMSSKLITEFAGKLITPQAVYVQPKWREISDRNFLDLARSIGPRVFTLLKPRQARVIRFLGLIPKGVHPWALGWNPQGLPYSERMVRVAGLLEQLSKPKVTSKSDVLASNSDLLYESMILQVHEYPLRYFSEEASQNRLSLERAKLSSDTKTRLLSHADIRYLTVEEEADETLDLLSTWLVNSDPYGDPRGVNQLEFIERFMDKASKD